MVHNAPRPHEAATAEPSPPDEEPGGATVTAVLSHEISPASLFVFLQATLLVCAIPVALILLGRLAQKTAPRLAAQVVSRPAAPHISPEGAPAPADVATRAQEHQRPRAAADANAGPAAVKTPGPGAAASAGAAPPVAQPVGGHAPRRRAVAAASADAGGAGKPGTGNDRPDPEPPRAQPPNPAPQPPPQHFAGGGWPDPKVFRFYARQRRIDQAQSREMVRSALRALASDGFFAFEDVLTKTEGAIDQLVVGPTGVHPVMVLAHRGHVYRSGPANALTWGRQKADPHLPDEEARWYTQPFEEPYDEVMARFAEDLGREAIFQDTAVMRAFCFTHADLVLGPGGKNPSNTATPWDLVSLLRDLDPEEAGLLRLDAELVRETVKLVVRNYNRTPWLVPPGEEAFAAGLAEDV